MSGDFSAAMLIPLLISGCGISLTAIVVLIYHLLIVHYCLGRQNQFTADTNLGFNNTDSVPATKLGIDNSALSLIPTGPYSARMFDDMLKGDQSECAICLADLEDGDPVRLLPNCRHAFHVECIDQWLSSHVNCPFCRSEIFPFVYSDRIMELKGGDDMEDCRIGRPVPVYRSKNNPPGSGIRFGWKNITPMENPNNPNTDNKNDVITSTPSSSTSNVVGDTSQIEINVAENENENNNNNNDNDNRPASSSTSFSSCPSPNASVNLTSEDSISSQFDKMSTRLMRSWTQLRVATWGTSSSSTVDGADSDSPC